MSPENQKFVDDNIHFAKTFAEAEYFKHLDYATRAGFVKLISEEFQPGYTADLNCSVCVGEMLKYAWRLYSEWKAKEETRIVHMTFPNQKPE